MANNIEKLVTICVEGAQGIEDALQQLMADRFVDTADGAQLDIIGRIVGQGREGLDDDDYRRLIRARIAANNSNGTVKDLITVTFLVVYDSAGYYEVITQGIATVVVRINNIAVTEAIADFVIDFLGDAVSAGVRVILEYSSQSPSTWFQWDTSGQGWDQGFFIDAKDNAP